VLDTQSYWRFKRLAFLLDVWCLVPLYADHVPVVGLINGYDLEGAGAFLGKGWTITVRA